MIAPIARFLPVCPRAALRLGIAAAALALGGPLSAQGTPGSFTLPEPTPTPAPAPAGPADERGGVAIPPRPVVRPSAAPAPAPTASAPLPLPSPTASRPAPPPTAAPAPARPDAAPAQPAPGAPVLPANPDALPPTSAPALPQDSDSVPAPEPSETALEPPDRSAPLPLAVDLPAWWPLAAGGLGALVLLAGAVLLWRRRKPAPLRLAAPAPDAAPPVAADPDALPRIDLALEITGATRSVMMFTLEWRLTLANRSERAVSDLAVAVQLACARATGGAGASPGAAQWTGQAERIGPHQARSLAGTVQLPLSAIAPLRQGTTPLFVPLLHVTLEAAGQRALARSFVIGTPSGGGAGRVHPIALDRPPGAIPGLVAQTVAIPAESAAA